jgi:hypothetical protein
MPDSKRRVVTTEQRAAVLKRSIAGLFADTTSAGGPLDKEIADDNAMMRNLLKSNVSKPHADTSGLEASMSKSVEQARRLMAEHSFGPDKDVPAPQISQDEHFYLWKNYPLMRHFKGGWYRILSVRKKKEGYTVNYISLHFGTMHTRDAAEFFGYVHRNGVLYQRFTPHEQPIPATKNRAWMAKYDHLA